MRGCPATGRMSHNYDKVTHRCKGCQRWQAGFKPKSDKPAAACAECQICEGQWAIVAGGISIHGYTRPGCGFITGECMGSRCRPFPATDAPQRYRRACENHVTRCVEQLAELAAAESVEYTYAVRVTGKPFEKEYRTHTINRGDLYRYDAEKRQTFPAFADEVRRRQEKLVKSREEARAEIRRAEARITRGEELAASPAAVVA